MSFWKLLRTAVGCAALHTLDIDSAEIACVAVHSEFQGRGYALKLLEYLEQRAINQNLNKIFVLSTQTAQWFQQQGYKETPVSDLPADRRDLYNYERKPKVLVKALGN